MKQEYFTAVIDWNDLAAYLNEQALRGWRLYNYDLVIDRQRVFVVLVRDAI